MWHELEKKEASGRKPDVAALSFEKNKSVTPSNETLE
jgi:hypothetical protein